jgi:excisionase family DNA binding protein
MQPRVDNLGSIGRDHLLTIPEVHELCSLSEKTIRRAIDRGDLRAVKLCNRVRVAPGDLRAWIDKSAVRPHDPPVPAPPRRRAASAPPAGGLRELLG